MSDQREATSASTAPREVDIPSLWTDSNNRVHGQLHDTMPPVTTIADMEAQAGADSLEVLHTKRRAILAEHEKILALHGRQGLFDDLRKSFLDVQKVRIRGDAEAKSLKATDASVDAAAHASTEYVGFLEQGLTDKIAALRAQVSLDEIEELIRNRDSMLYLHGAAMRLQR